MRILCWLLFLVVTRTFHAHFSKPKRQPRLWINTTYQAEDNGIRIADLPQCEAWNKWWLMQEKDIDLTPEDVDRIAARKKSLLIASKGHLRRQGISEGILDRYQAVFVNFEEVCKNHSRVLWINSTKLVRRYKLNTALICAPYRKVWRPSVNDIDSIINSVVNSTHDLEHEGTASIGRSRRSRKSGYRQELGEVERVVEPSFSFVSVYNKQDGIRRMDTVVLVDRNNTDAGKGVTTDYVVDVDEEDEHPVVILRNSELADRLGLNASEAIFHLHQMLGISLKAVCNGDAPELIRNGPAALSLEEKRFATNMGIHLEATDFDIERLAETLRNDTKLDDILQTFDQISVSEEQPLSSTFILPVLKRGQYDHRTPPTLFTGQTVDVRVGIHIQSISNFELTTMDYDVDVWLRMVWRDPRLAHGFDKPILINDEMFLKRIWRPDPFFANAKLALFHRVTYLNFYMFVFPEGEVFFESRLYLKPSCQLVLCKYPHDNQMCSLRISSLGFTNDVMRLRWFSNIKHAISRNKHVQLPELYIVGYSKHECNGYRKSGNFSCLEARFYMKRNLGYHMAQTYIPTAMCVIFSWISVWLPEEFVDGRIFISLTVFLTLSAESTSAKEILPKVSYTKAIDIWFGFTATFVFATMLQALVVISLEHNSIKLRKEAEEGLDHIPRFQVMKLMLKSKRCHRMARTVDTYCKAFYPVILVLFLIVYRLVIIEGEETKCLR